MNEKWYLQMNFTYTLCFAVYFVECAVKLENISVFMLYFLCIEIGSERVNKELLGKFTIIINLYALIRACSWNSYDLYAFIGGILLLLIHLYLLLTKG